MEKGNRISIAIPIYDMNGKGLEFLMRNLDSISRQTFKDFDVVISDNSTGRVSEAMEELARSYQFKVTYYRNDRIGMAPNTNEAIKRCTGEIIKILYQDDFLTTESALQDISDAFKDNVVWLATACTSENGTNYPYYTHNMILGENKIGSPSVIAFRNKDLILFDETMTWVLDCKFYVNMYDKYGYPTYLMKVCTTIGLGRHQVTNMLSDGLKREEVERMKKEYLVC